MTCRERAPIARLFANRLLVAALLVVAPFLAFAQQNQKVWRIGCLSVSDLTISPHLMDAFRAGLRENGFEIGKNVVIDCQWVEGTNKRLDNLAEGFVRSKVDVILAWTTPAVVAAKRATRTIPIVMTSIGDPVGSGLVTSLGRPGGNVTGVTNLDADLAGKRFQLLREILPKLSKMIALRNPTNPSAILQFKETQDAGRSLGIELQFVDARNPGELESAFSSMAMSHVSAVTVLADSMFMNQRKQIADFAIRSRIPTVFARNENVEAGGFLSYGPTLTDQFHEAAIYVAKILNGAKPAELPVERPTRIELLINMKTAKILALTVPQSLLLRADRVIE